VQLSDVPTRPRLKPWYRVARVEDGVAVEYGDSVLRFGGRAATKLLPLLLELLDGTRTVKEIGSALGEPIAPAIDHALATLAQNGLLADGLPPEQPGLLARSAAFCSASSGGQLDEQAATACLEGSTARVLGSGPLASEVLRLLRLSGLGDVRAFDWSDDCAHAGLVVVAPAAEELGRLPGWNATCLRERVAWLQLLPFNGRLAIVGPLYVPGETACYGCFRLRRAANVGFAEEFWALEGAHATWGSTAALDALLAGAAGVLILRWLLVRDALLPGRFFTISFDDALTVRAHEVLRVPRCAACSGLAGVASPLPWGDFA
jgi:bacteriocin biosynthesis cyclodehydratase domain-containing protein